MHKYLSYFIIVSVLQCLGYASFGQTLDDVVVNQNYRGQTIQEILYNLSSKYSVQIHVPIRLLPPQRLDVVFSDQPIPEVIEKLLEKTDLTYFIYRDYGIIIGTPEIINQHYQASYYQALENTLRASAQSGQNEIISIGDIQQLSPTGKAQLSGTIKDTVTKEPIAGATLYFPDVQLGSSTGSVGEFVLTLPTGRHLLQLQYIGYEPQELELEIFGDGELDILMTKSAVDLEEVLVRAQSADVNVESAQIGVARLDVKALEKLPTLLGETDVVRSLLLQPGVSTVGEGATGFNVRGGEVDQNLVMVDEGFIFNSSHALGFFSSFNADLISQVALYKGNIPAQFGGRLSSVLDVEMRDGNFRKFKLKGGLGPVSSRISVEGPILKDKSSFIIGLRSTYSDWILQRINVPAVKRSSAFFYDANIRYTHRINSNNILILSAYGTQDEFTFDQQFGFDYQTLMGQVIYKTIFNENLFSSLSLTGSQYQSRQFDLEGVDASVLNNDISYLKLKDQLSFSPGNQLKIDLGASGIFYWIAPETLDPLDERSLVRPQVIEPEKGLETAAFLNADWMISPVLQLSGGLRLSWYTYLGPKTVYQYTSDGIFDLKNSTGKQNLTGSIATYANLEPRLSLRYRLRGEASIKAGYSRVAQYINQLSDSSTPTPTSKWQLSTAYIRPQTAHNASVGYFRNFRNNSWESSAEVFGRYIDDLFDYKNFAELSTNDHLETELLTGRGRAYGLELSLKKNDGFLHGWINYTLARTEREVEGINRGNWYPANIDQTHNMTLVANLQFNQRNTVTINFNYITGRPTTPPTGSYTGPNGLVIPVYTQRNQLRIPDYHRLDIAYTVGKGYNKKKKFKTSWTFSIYNLYGRRNAFSVYFTQKPFNAPTANRLSVLGNAFPSLSFNIESF